MSRHYKTRGRPIARIGLQLTKEHRPVPFRLAIVAALAFAFIGSAAAASVCELKCPRIDESNAGGGKVSIADLDWLVGNWIDDARGAVVRERWAGPYGEMMLGVGVTLRPNGKSSFEFFRIAKTATGVSYFASPNAAAPTEFKATELTSSKVVFENKAHDFPQRVMYWREGNGLHARVEGVINGKLEGEDWTYRAER